ncbi:MAG: hydroxyphenylacetyl-CoA thioesterase PaaI [Rhodobacteraceae bacterium]|nr:hydroxyphenylacetyl-CoA thioesterase PaaI [Paracoccaceae bacterium]
MTPEERASRSAAAMRAEDRAADWFGHEIVAVGPGSATLRMRVRDEHLNGHGICHGGVIFTLADTAFAYACNSYNRLVVAQHNTISYLSPGKPGEMLTAVAVEASRAGRSGIYDVTVTGEDGRKVALFRGASRQIDGQHFEEET